MKLFYFCKTPIVKKISSDFLNFINNMINAKVRYNPIKNRGYYDIKKICKTFM